MSKHNPKVISAVKSKEVYHALNEVALEMRENPTEAERILWEELRAGKLGVKFRRQHIIDRFIVDFYCIKNGLVIELDGDIHKFQKERGFEREKILEGLGCTILRFKNEEIEENVENVLDKIIETIDGLL
jgi:very-short-patch-repair endonuclease